MQRHPKLQMEYLIIALAAGLELQVPYAPNAEVRDLFEVLPPKQKYYVGFKCQRLSFNEPSIGQLYFLTRGVGVRPSHCR